MAQPSEAVRKVAAVAKSVKPKEVIQLDGTTAKVVAIFTDIDFRASNGGFGHRKGYVVADGSKRAVLVGATTLDHTFPLAMDDAKPANITFSQREQLVKLLASFTVLNPCELVAPGSAKTRPTYAKTQH